jgi:AmmeMemoRadiSam system radical SAM enzyme/AmmeMemoRadiSam system protein B/AmmeMemoRadiSam system protein A
MGYDLGHFFRAGHSHMSRVVTLPEAGAFCADGAKIAGWWRQADDNGKRIVCDLCPRACTLRPGDRGFCFVRENRDGQMVSTTYGRSTGFCIDPIEKKPLNQFYPGTAVLSFGTAGCNLGCIFCQNWSSTKSRDVDAACEVADPRTIAEAARELGCRSVAFTYNDPIVWSEYAIDAARACRALGIKTVAVTSGYVNPAPRSAFYEVMDAANVDLKAFSDEFYVKMTSGRLDPVLDTLRWIVRESNTWLEITNLLIPQANDSADELGRLCGWIVDELGPDVPLHFSAFHPDFKLTDREPTPLETLLKAHEIARRAGLHYVYMGNVSDREHQNTYCPGCGRAVIERDGYVLEAFHVRDGRCAHCGATIAGRFDPTPGTWGGRRQPVRIDKYARPAGFVRPMLDAEQEQLVFRAAGRCVAAAVRSQPRETLDGALADAAELPVYGAFVSLKRAGQLRSCCGYLGGSIRLSEAVEHAALRAAKEDPRFPPISPAELEHLDMEVWLLWGLQPVAARGEDRARGIVIGKHGLQIACGNARGLLLPGVAVEHKLDAEGFLGQVCRKAGLPMDAWKRDDASLMTFEGYAIRGRLPLSDGGDSPAAAGPTSADLVALLDLCRTNLRALLRGATPSYYLPGGFDGGVSGLTITVGLPGAQQIACSRLSPQAAVPLQATLFSMVEATARALQTHGVNQATIQTAPMGLSVLTDPTLQGTAARPDLQGVDPRRQAVLVSSADGWAWVYDPARPADELLREAVELAGVADPALAAVAGLAVFSTEPKMAAAQTASRETGGSPDDRPPAVAGAFYPGQPDELDRMLDEMFAQAPQREPEPWAGALVPHAGWTYSGRLAAAVFSRVKIPERVLVLCPRHRPGGSPWAVAPHRRWMLPGRQVESDPELAARLAAAVTGLTLDAEAHRQEHAIEVQLPLLARLAPHARVVGIAIGGGDLDELLRFGAQLAGVLRDMPERPLLVISSDMSHFADDAAARRLDRLALDAIETLDPATLYETVHNRITMCGMLPAVIVMETLRQLGCLHRCELVGYATSADTTGDPQRVVGYAGLLLG